MRPTFFGFEAAKTAVYANQKSLDIVGNNLANTNTDGYTRQRVERASVYYSPASSRIASSAVNSAGAGVKTLGVSQIRDAFVDKCYRNEVSLTNYYSKSADILNDIVDIFPEAADITDDPGLAGALEDLYTSLSNYIKNPTLESEANIVKTSFANIVQVLNRADTSLSVVAERQTTDLDTTVDRANELLEQISNLNEAIAKDVSTFSNTDSSYFGPNELIDKRNMLLDELSKYCDINVKNNDDLTVDIEIGGHTALDKNGYDALNMTTNSKGYVSVSWLSEGTEAALSTGSINAYVEIINGRGPNVQSNDETTSHGIPYFRDRINTFASQLTEIANSTIPDTDSSGNILHDVNGDIIYKTLLAAKQADGTTTTANDITAANISISDEWNTKGAGYFIFSKDENVEDYAQQMATKLFESDTNFSSYGEKFEGNFSEYVIDLVGKAGTDTGFNEGRSSAAASVADSYLAKREEISGVQRDEETANMIMYQKSYQAAARVMTVMDSLLDTLINQLGARIS